MYIDIYISSIPFWVMYILSWHKEKHLIKNNYNACSGNYKECPCCTNTYTYISRILFSSFRTPQKTTKYTYELATRHTKKLLTLHTTTNDPHFSGFFSSVSLFQFNISSRTSSSIGFPPSLATSALNSASSSSSVCPVYLKEPKFSSNVTQCFFSSTSSVRCRRIPDWC